MSENNSSKSNFFLYALGFFLLANLVDKVLAWLDQHLFFVLWVVVAALAAVYYYFSDDNNDNLKPPPSPF